MNIQFTGKIIAAEPYQQGTSQRGTQWCSQSFCIEELNQQYPSRAVFQVYGSDKLQQFNIQVGEIITANLSPKAHQAQDGRWFNQLDCWKVERFGAQPAPQPQGQTYQSAVGQPANGYQQPAQPPQPNNFPPQVDSAGQPINQQPPSGGGQPQGGGLPFPQMN